LLDSLSAQVIYVTVGSDDGDITVLKRLYVHTVLPFAALLPGPGQATGPTLGIGTPVLLPGE
jgi:hypothetical protein